jgi:beta-phosphoglucomutase-like phosphatase (HAD superfamily)
MRRGLIFDLDGVIADTERFIALATREMFRELYGVEFDLDEFRPYVGTGAVRYVEGPAEKAGIAIDTAGWSFGGGVLGTDYVSFVSFGD